MRPKIVLATPPPLRGPKVAHDTRPAPEFDQTVPPGESEYSSYCSESPLTASAMKRLPVTACEPVLSPTVTPAAPLVQSTVTLVLTSSAVVLLATTGS